MDFGRYVRERNLSMCKVESGGNVVVFYFK